MVTLEDMKEVKCPNCQTLVTWNDASIHRPFCSQRCKLIDFGGWANEEYKIVTKNNPDQWKDLDAEQIK